MTTRTFDARPSPFHPAHHSIYALANLPDPAFQSAAPRSWSWFLPWGLDQGQEGACVGHGITEELYNKPDMVDFAKRWPIWAAKTLEVIMRQGSKQEIAQAYAFDSYYEFRRQDEFPGEDYEGTSLNAGAKLTKALGYWKGYYWAGNALELRRWLRFGNVVAATPWFDGFDRPTPSSKRGFQGWFEPTGAIRGWHCYLLNRNSESHGGLWTPNSWGGDGQGWFSFETIDRMIQENEAEYLIPMYREVRT
jgi:hypothetical protein